MVVVYNVKVNVISKSVKGQVFFRRLLIRQNSIVNAFGVTLRCPRCL